LAPGLELKARHGYVVAPPSRNDTGGEYTWITPWSDVPLADLPSWLECRARSKRNASPPGRHPESIVQGGRNSALTSLAGKLRRAGVSEEGLRACLQVENRARCVPPLPEHEVDGVARSISRYTDGAAGGPLGGWPSSKIDCAYHGPAGEFVRLVGPHTEADPVALLVQFLVGFGNLIGRGAFIQVEADRHFTNEFVALVGESSKARKGTAAGHVAKVMNAVDPIWAGTRQQSGLSSGEGLIWAVRDAITGRSPVRERGHVTSYEEVEEDPGVEDKRLLVYEPEFASTLRVMGRDGSTLSPVLRQAWENGTLRTLTKKSPAVATDAHVSLATHITRDELRRYLDRTEAANGFANRFMWFCVRRSKVLSRGGNLNRDDLHPLIEQLRRAAERARSTKEVRYSEEAWELWDQTYEELSKGRPGLLGAVTSRSESHAMRLALIYALLDEAEEIERPHLEAALALWGFSEASARYIFGEALGDPVADALLTALRAQPQGLTDTEINSGVFGRNRPSSEITRAKNELQARRLIYSVSEATGGRSAQRWLASSTTKQTNETNEASAAPSCTHLDGDPSSNSFHSSLAVVAPTETGDSPYVGGVGTSGPMC